MLMYRGAEAELWKKEYLGFPCIEKRRVTKTYRIPEIDQKIAADRIKREVDILVEAKKAIEVPYVFSVDLSQRSFLMEYIDGTRLKECKDIPSKAKVVGACVRRLHELGIIHGDLTTSNIILKKKTPYFIDFGLAAKSKRTEDTAMDLLVFKKMLKSTHYAVFEEIWANFLKGYKPSANIQGKIKEIERRARYSERN